MWTCVCDWQGRVVVLEVVVVVRDNVSTRHPSLLVAERRDRGCILEQAVEQAVELELEQALVVEVVVTCLASRWWTVVTAGVPVRVGCVHGARCVLILVTTWSGGVPRA